MKKNTQEPVEVSVVAVNDTFATETAYCAARKLHRLLQANKRVLRAVMERAGALADDLEQLVEQCHDTLTELRKKAQGKVKP